MGTENKRRENIDLLLRRVLSIKNREGTVDPKVFEETLNKFSYEQGIRRRTVKDYLDTLVGAGLLKL